MREGVVSQEIVAQVREAHPVQWEIPVATGPVRGRKAVKAAPVRKGFIHAVRALAKAHGGPVTVADVVAAVGRDADDEVMVRRALAKAVEDGYLATGTRKGCGRGRPQVLYGTFAMFQSEE